MISCSICLIMNSDNINQKNNSLHKRYLVILADRQSGRFFTIYLNNFEDQGEEFIDEGVPQKVKTEGFRIGKMDSYIREHLRQHLKHVGKKALDYLIKKRIKGIEGVVLVSHKELLSFLRHSLPSKLKNKVIAEMVSEIDVSIGDLTNRITKELNLK